MFLQGMIVLERTIDSDGRTLSDEYETVVSKEKKIMTRDTNKGWAIVYIRAFVLFAGDRNKLSVFWKSSQLSRKSLTTKAEAKFWLIREEMERTACTPSDYVYALLPRRCGKGNSSIIALISHFILNIVRRFALKEAFRCRRSAKVWG